MANFFTRLFGTTEITALQEANSVANKLLAETMAQDAERTRLQESVRELSLWMEDRDWIPINGWEEEKGFDLATIQREADHIRALLTVNPTIKKAVNARVGYIWGRGVTFEGDALTKQLTNVHNRNVIFGEQAKWKLEAQLATDGNIFTVRNKRSGEVIMVPIHQIAGYIIDIADPSRVNYWLRTYTVIKKNLRTGNEEAETISMYYPAYGYTGNTVASIDGIKVDRESELIHLAANRQDGWIFGIPDILAAMFWAQGHKELFEAGTAFVKAQGRYASKVISKTGAGAQRAAAAVADAPRRDPVSGEVLDIGGTAVMSAGLDMQLMGKMSGGVDFEAFDPVAGLIAVGLGIPLDVILGKSHDTETSLEQSTVDEMKMRQKLWVWYFEAIFAPRKVKVIFPKIKSEPTYRLVQSLEITNKTVSLSREEIRGLTLEAYGIEGDPNDLPDIEENAAYLMAKAIADDAAERAEDAAEQAAELAPTTPEQGVDAGVGKLSTGADAKDSRNDKSDRNTANAK